MSYDQCEAVSDALCLTSSGSEWVLSSLVSSVSVALGAAEVIVRECQTIYQM